MYQIKLSTEKKYSYWIQYLLEAVGDSVADSGGVFAEQSTDARYSVCFAAEQCQKSKIRDDIRKAIVELFITLEKRMYFINALNIRFCDSISRDMLVNTLSSFNGESEREYVSDNLRLSNDFNLDGFYNFTLRELRREWRESACLILENSDLVREEESFNVILKFLLSGIEARSKIISVNKSDEAYTVSCEADNTSKNYYSAEQMLLSLIDIAPEKIVVKNTVTDKRLRKKLREIFCVREENIEKI